MACIEFIKIHHDVVRQVSFVRSMNSFVSASESTITKSAYLPSVIIGNLDTARESQIVFRMNSVTKPDEILTMEFAIHLKNLLLSLFASSHARAQVVLPLMKVLKLWQQVRLCDEDSSRRKTSALLCLRKGPMRRETFPFA